MGNKAAKKSQNSGDTANIAEWYPEFQKYTKSEHH